MGENIPSLKKVAEAKNSPEELYIPKGVRFKKKTFLRASGYVFLIMLVLGMVLIGYGASLDPTVKYVVADRWDKSWELKPGYYNHHTWKLESPHDAFLEINATVSGGNGDLDVYIDTPSGRVNYGRLTNPVHVTVNLSRYGVGEYTIYLDNSFSVVTSKYITLHEAVYRKVQDTTDKDAYQALGGILMFVGFFGVLYTLSKRVILEVDGDEIVMEFKSGLLKNYVELTVNGFKLDQKIKGPVKFRVGQNEDKVLEIEPIVFLNLAWKITLDGQFIGGVP
ncbi:hypothetical protein [Thermococcus pacificus]|uniref:Uncharacterized protein n=1 Tax=Thermococcus pacificus TaxID=71998 RepID=A0A218P8V9_9EURY|nr:hypothetical protein [Thermococcus pacificus]ASJ07208.1 hypothetical protein A3L08_07695 [Thermococcus pacificus]